MKKPGQYCARCRTVHHDGCPDKPKHNFGSKVRSRTDGRGGRPWRRKRQRIFERDNYLCKIHLDKGIIRTVELHGPNHGVLDHKIPETQGGSDEDENLQTICIACDKEKRQKESMQRGV